LRKHVVCVTHTCTCTHIGRLVVWYTYMYMNKIYKILVHVHMHTHTCCVSWWLKLSETIWSKRLPLSDFNSLTFKCVSNTRLTSNLYYVIFICFRSWSMEHLIIEE
jgi:hypothetical protein